MPMTSESSNPKGKGIEASEIKTIRIGEATNIRIVDKILRCFVGDTPKAYPTHKYSVSSTDRATDNKILKEYKKLGITRSLIVKDKKPVTTQYKNNKVSKNVSNAMNILIPLGEKQYLQAINHMNKERVSNL